MSALMTEGSNSAIKLIGQDERYHDGVLVFTWKCQYVNILYITLINSDIFKHHNVNISLMFAIHSRNLICTYEDNQGYLKVMHHNYPI